MDIQVFISQLSFCLCLNFSPIKSKKKKNHKRMGSRKNERRENGDRSSKKYNFFKSCFKGKERNKMVAGWYLRSNRNFFFLRGEKV